MQHPGNHQHHHDQRAIQEMIEYQGFALFHGGGSTTRPWSHTIGLYDSEHERPELFICGLPKQLRVAWLLDLGFRMKGPPSHRALEEESRARGIPIEALSYPPGGEVFRPGKIYRFAQGDLPGCFGEVAPRFYENYLWHARSQHGHDGFPVLQYVFSDTRGYFPWSMGCEAGTRLAQVLLFDPRQYLPLLEDEA